MVFIILCIKLFCKVTCLHIYDTDSEYQKRHIYLKQDKKSIYIVILFYNWTFLKKKIMTQNKDLLFPKFWLSSWHANYYTHFLDLQVTKIKCSTQTTLNKRYTDSLLHYYWLLTLSEIWELKAQKKSSTIFGIDCLIYQADLTKERW